jgi:peptidoglycan hydrolase-like protein with peptidoglycan-binding domain
MSEQENTLQPLLGSMVPKGMEPLKPTEPTPPVAEAKVEEIKEVKKESKSAPKVKRDANTIISLSALKVGAMAGNSSSVQTVQLRLKDLGFDAVVRDKFGRLGEGSVEAINAYRKSVGLDENSSFGEDVLAYLFDGLDVGVGA